MKLILIPAVQPTGDTLQVVAALR